jgi:hypothetical protein
MNKSKNEDYVFKLTEFNVFNNKEDCESDEEGTKTDKTKL